MNDIIPVFQHNCLDWEDVLQDASIAGMLKRVKKQAQSEEAYKRMDRANYKEQFVDEKVTFCPAYFGLFMEWYGQHFLTHFGSDFRLDGVAMHDRVGNAYKDLGIDGVAVNTSPARYKTIPTTPTSGSPVFLQVKATTYHTKTHSPNDGSRLNNFMTNALTTAALHGDVKFARYVLLTTAKGIHRTQHEMCNGFMEVIGYNKIAERTDDNIHFLNVLRTAVDLKPFDIVKPVDELFATPADCDYPVVEISE